MGYLIPSITNKHANKAKEHKTMNKLKQIIERMKERKTALDEKINSSDAESDANYGYYLGQRDMIASNITTLEMSLLYRPVNHIACMRG